MTKAEVVARQILFPVDVLGVDRAALAGLVAMAERLEAGLIGLFLEDDALSQAAALPFVREVVMSGAAERDMTAEALRRRSRRLARTVQEQLAELTSGRRVTCRFDFVAAATSRAAAALTFAGDIYLPARVTGARFPRSTGEEVRFRRVRMIYREGKDSARAMEIVHRLARNGHTREVLVVSDRPLPQAVASALGSLGVRLQVEVHDEPLVRYLLTALARPACDLLMIPRSLFDEVPGADIDAALNRVIRPVLLVST